MNKSIFQFVSGMRRCNRSYMEDELNYDNKNNINIFNICDGHGGIAVSKIINNNFISDLQKIIQQEELKHQPIPRNNMISIIHNVVNNLDNLTLDHILFKKIGSTFIGVLIYFNKIYIINIGDSVAILNKNQSIYFKSVLHNLDNIEEIKRVKQTAIIKNKRINGYINVTRSFGDYKFKSENNKGPMISTPDITIFKKKDFLKNNKFPWILLSSDGLFCTFSESEIHTTINLLLILDYNIHQINELLLNYCDQKLNADNVSLILILLQPIQHDFKKQKYLKEILNEFKNKIIKDLEYKYYIQRTTDYDIERDISKFYNKHIILLSPDYRILLKILKLEISKNIIKKFKN